MSDIINHEEAFQLACIKRETSNLARCYIAVKAERDALLAALQDIAKYTSKTHPNNLAEVLDENANIACAAIDAARGDK